MDLYWGQTQSQRKKKIAAKHHNQAILVSVI